MKIFWTIFIFIGQQIVITGTKELHELINSQERYAKVIFTKTFLEINPDQTVLIKTLMSHDPPAVIIDLNKVNRTNDKRPFEMSIFENPRKSVIYLIIPNGKFDESVMLEDVVNMSPITSIPKSLLISPTEYSSDKLNKIFSKAWSLKFLDFSIITTLSDGQHTFVTYNPFSNDLTTKYLSEIDEFFPDKLKNVHGYPLKTRVFHAPPILMIETKDNKILKVNGTSFSRIQIVAKKLNFKLEFVENFKNESVSTFTTVDNLELNEINVTPVGFLVRKIFQNRNILIGNPMDLAKVVVVAPVIKKPVIDLSENMFMIILSFLIIMMIFLTFVRSLKFETNYWNIFYIFGILISNPTLKPQRRASKIIFITIAILSIIFSNAYFSTLANVKLKFVDEEINSYEDLDRLNIPIYSPAIYINNGREKIRKLVFKEIDSIDKCIELLMRTDKAACVSTLQKAKHFSEINRDSFNEPVMKITDLTFQYQLDAYMYERASPFAEKIEKVLRQIFESNLISIFESLAKSKIQIIVSKQSTLVEEILLRKIILIILFTGYASACVALAFEYAYFYGISKM